MKKTTILIITAILAFCSCNEELDSTLGKIEDVTDVTVKEFLAKPVAENPWYKIDGKILTIEDEEAGVFYLEDETGTLYVSGVSKENYSKGFQLRSNPMNFKTTGAKEGDIITIVGIRKVSDGFPTMGGPAYYISHKADEGGNGNEGDEGGEVLPPAPGQTTCRYDWAELPGIEDQNSDGICDSNKDYYYAHHWCAGGEKVKGVTARNFTVCYSEDNVCPMWVAAPRHSMYKGGSGRSEAYKPDPKIERIKSGIQYYSKKTGGGCNKGHMLGSGDRTCSRATNEQVFYFSNIAPQNSSSYNTGGGAWNNLEGLVDDLDCSDTLYQVVGCYFKEYTDAYGNIARPKKISFGGRSDSSWPTMMYIALLRTKSGHSGKAVTECSANELQCVAFCISHAQKKGHQPEAKDMISIADLEKLTGFTYFVNVPNAPKNSFNPNDWLK